MKIRTVQRKEIRSKRPSRSKYSKLYAYLDKLVEGGDMVEVSYEKVSELNSIRNLVYNYNKSNGRKIRSSTDTLANVIYFMIGK